MSGPSPHKGRTKTQIRLATKERERKALDLRILGYPLDRIAQEVGYTNRSAAHKAITRALAAIPAVEARELRAIELERLDLAQRKVMPGVLREDLPSIDRMLRIMDARARLLGLYEVQPDTGVEAVTAVLAAWIGQVQEIEAVDASLPRSDLELTQLPPDEDLPPQIESYAL